MTTLTVFASGDSHIFASFIKSYFLVTAQLSAGTISQLQQVAEISANINIKFDHFIELDKIYASN